MPTYHSAWRFIRHDPAAGGGTCPADARADAVSGHCTDTYASLYHEPLPADAWSIHSYILREASCAAYPESCWGAEVPPGISATHGMLYTLDDIDNLDIFRQRIVQFRQWMKDRGYRGVPLLITEYGSLLPYYNPEELYYDSQGHPFDEARARNFMHSTFEYLRAATDPNLVCRDKPLVRVLVGWRPLLWWRVVRSLLVGKNAVRHRLCSLYGCHHTCS
jgi:hypothetical protein